MKGRSTCIITRIKVLWAFVRPKGITIHSYNPSFVLDAISICHLDGYRFVATCGEDFPVWVIRRSIHNTNESMCLRYKCKITNTTQTIDGDTIFLCENSNQKKPRRGRKFTITRQFTWIACMCWYFWVRIRWKAQKSSSQWRRSICTELLPQGRWGADEICVTVRSSCRIYCIGRDCWRNWDSMQNISSLSITVCLVRMSVTRLQRQRGEVTWLQVKISGYRGLSG